MKFHKIVENKNFVGREQEWKILQAVDRSSKAEIIAIYGRRRVGKTELIEQFFLKNNVWKFEGIQPDLKKKKGHLEERRYQIFQCLRVLGKYLQKEKEYSLIKIDYWSQFFDLLLPHLEKRRIILYFEEVQWIANYQDEFMAELKQFWDNHFRHIKKFRLIFSGSSPSFIIGQFLSQSAMYNRSEHLIHLMPFSLQETQAFLKKSNNRELMLATLYTGGVCEYLKQVKGKNTIFQNLCEKSFSKDGFFVHEYNKIFVSNMSTNRHYLNVIRYLAQVKYATRNQIAKKVLKQSSAGGEFTKLLIDLETCGFIERYTPIESDVNTILSRYILSDEYLQFFFKFIQPNLKNIQKSIYNQNPLKVVTNQQFSIVMGLNFERWCRKNEYLLAQIMNFGNVEYKAGAFFNRKTETDDPTFQIDLMYIRKDHRIIICEIKYYDGIVGAKVKNDVNKKLEKFKELRPKYKNYSYETALITTEGTTPTLKDYFDYIITFDQLV